MTTLVIHAPTAKARKEGKRSFEETVKAQIGDGYAIAKKLVSQLSSGNKVVVLDKWKDARAEGKLVQLVKKEKAGNGIQRYDVHIRDLKIVPYKPESLNRNGIAII